MKGIMIGVLAIIGTSSYAEGSALGKKVYETACARCHAPQLAKALQAPAAFDAHAWNAREKNAKTMSQAYPARFATPLAYLLYSVQRGKGLMHHGGLCKESHTNLQYCSDKALQQAIQYMMGKAL